MAGKVDWYGHRGLDAIEEEEAVWFTEQLLRLALAIMTSFLVLSHYDPQFFLLHFYESLMYIAIVVLLFYL